jgi:hypothetical protein
MTNFWHTLFHALAIIAQIGVAASGLVPAPFQPLAAGLISAAQAAVALYNHYFGK